MHYLIYKTICLINGKYYVGKHKTKNRDDGYLGSGKLLQTAIKKYGRENFTREIILECSTEDEMNLAEKILVVPDIEVNYNLCPGGHGGWGYITKNSLNGGCVSPNSRNNLNVGDAKLFETWRIMRPCESEAALIKATAARKHKYPNGTFFKHKHTDETKYKMSIKAKNRNTNSQTGTMWITNGTENKKIKRDSPIPEFWYRGRV